MGSGLGMILEGKYELGTPRQRLWEFITDPDKIGKCLPDLKTLNVESDDTFTAVVRVGVGFMKADFKLKVEIVGKEPLSRVQLRAVGTGSGSNINMDLAIELKEIPQGSELDYKTDVKVSGMMASLGQRVIKDTAERTVAGIFDCVRKQLE
jgi:carbon monoxide dehydrogenase subunit G